MDQTAPTVTRYSFTPSS